ncbi:uncharacterized protein LOC135817776 [Sycon ciliatum]|uniref:uncharacterized protein LOC135817776 n=1 Tax=Sycon ciliatum TaxID=27933 RepID=UPI0031F6860F
MCADWRKQNVSMSSTDHIPARTKRATAAARIELACTANEIFTNSPKRRRKAATLKAAASASSLKAAASKTPPTPPPRRLPRGRFGSSASFDCVLDREHSPKLENSSSTYLRGRENSIGGNVRTRISSVPGSRISPNSAGSLSPDVSNARSTEGPPTETNNSPVPNTSFHTSANAVCTGVSEAHANATSGQSNGVSGVTRVSLDGSAIVRPKQALTVEDCAARFVNRLTLDLCASSSLFSDVCDAQLFHEKHIENTEEREADKRDVGLGPAQSIDPSSRSTSHRMEASAAGNNGPTIRDRSEPSSAQSNNRRRALKNLDMGSSKDHERSTSSPLSPGKEPVLSPKDGMIFSYFDVAVSEQGSSAERRTQYPLIPTSSDRSVGLFRRTLCVNTLTVSPVLPADPVSSSSGTATAADSAEFHTTLSSGVDYTSAENGGDGSAAGAGVSVVRAGSVSTTGYSHGRSTTCSPVRSPRTHNGSISSEHRNTTNLPHRSKSTRVLSRLFDRVFRRHQSEEAEEERGSERAAARVLRTPSTSTSSNTDMEHRRSASRSDTARSSGGGGGGQFSPSGGDAMTSSCASLNDGRASSLSDSAVAISINTPEPQLSAFHDGRAAHVRRTLTKFGRSITGRRSSATSLEREATPGLSLGSSSHPGTASGDDDEHAAAAMSRNTTATPEGTTLSAIPQSPPEQQSHLHHFNLADGVEEVDHGSLGQRVPRTEQESTRAASTEHGQSLLRHSSPPYAQGVVKVTRRSLTSSSLQQHSHPGSRDSTPERQHHLERRLSGDLHGRALNSVSPRTGSPVSARLAPKTQSSAPVVIREPKRSSLDGHHMRKSHSMDEDTMTNTLMEAKRRMPPQEYEALKVMLSTDGKNTLSPPLSPPLSPKQWSVSLDHLADGADPELQTGSLRVRNERDVRRLSGHDNKYIQSANASPSVTLPSRLTAEDSRNISRSLSSLFKRKHTSGSQRSSQIAQEVDQDGRPLAKGTSIESLNSIQAGRPATAAPGQSSSHHPGSSVSSETWSESYGQVLGQGNISSRRYSSPPPIDFHPPNKPKSEMTHHDMRQHVLQTLLDTEMKYVGSLRTLVRDYFSQLKRNSYIESALVEEIFFQIPVINLCHKRFNQQLRERADKWHSQTVLGDIFLQSFSKGILSHAYTAYINHFLQMKDTLRTAIAQRPSFAKFLEQVSRESEDKLTLSDLLIMPVQRIPRYVLILKDLLKHCPYDHPDHGPLLQALDAMCALAEKMNRSEEQATNLELLREIETCFNGVVPGLVAPHRQLVRKDRVSEAVGSQTKERLLILMNDVLLCATVRRRTGSRKGTVAHSSLMSSSDANTRYKLMWRAMVKDISVIQTQEELNLDLQAKREIQLLEKDLITLSEISVKCESLVSHHQDLYLSINSMIKGINDGIQERKSLRELATLTLTVDSKNARSQPVPHILVFQSSEEKSMWIQDFKGTKEKLDQPLDGHDSWHRAESDSGSLGESATLMSVSPAPRYLYNIPMMKTRSGMQITCACPSVAPGHLTPTAVAAKANGQLWVCASDGHVGQVCMVNTEKLSPRLTACITVCDSRITSIIAVTEYVPTDIQYMLHQQETTKLVSGHHMSYDSDSENEGSGDESSSHETRSPQSGYSNPASASASGASAIASGASAIASPVPLAPGEDMPDGAELKKTITETHSTLLDRRLPSTVTEETEVALSFVSTPTATAVPAPLQDQVSDSQLHNFGTKMSYVKSSPQLLLNEPRRQGDVTENVTTTSSSTRRDSAGSPPPKSSLGRKTGLLADSLAHTDGETGENTPVPSSPATFLQDQKFLASESTLMSSSAVPLSELSPAEEPAHMASAELSRPRVAPVDLPLSKTMVESSSASSTSVTSPVVCEPPQNTAVTVTTSASAGGSPAHRAAPARGDSTEDVFVAASLLSRVRHFNALAETTLSPTKPRPAVGQTGDFVDSGIIAGDEGSASSVGGVSRSGSDVSSRSNTAARHAAVEKARVPTARSQSLTESRTRRVGRSFSHSTTLVSVTQRQKISAAHLIISQQTNNLANDGKRHMDHDPTMWLGTDNGLLYIYRAGDSIRMRQRRTVLRLKFGVVKLCHTGNSVYASLKDGHLIVFTRTPGGNWDTRDPEEIVTNLPGSVVTSMIVVDTDLWCACRDRILIIGKDSAFVKGTIVVGRDPSAKVSFIANLGLCVYVAMETGGLLHCYNAGNHEHLFDIDTMANVAQMLTGCDTIIRQHKINCLRITALESYRGLIWTGTSAGVVLTLQHMPAVTKRTTGKDIGDVPQPQASYNGHTGPVRFITATERMSKQPVAGATNSGSDARDRTNSHETMSRQQSSSEQGASAPSSVHSTPLHSVSSMERAAALNTDVCKYVANTDVEALIVTGGDGFEDFKATPIADNDDFAHDDSSSHLLIWQMTC